MFQNDCTDYLIDLKQYIFKLKEGMMWNRGYTLNRH